MKTDYAAHDEEYIRRRAQGRPGWQDEETLTNTLAMLEESLHADYVPKGGRLLELGCGAGDITLWLAGEGYDIYGVDIAPTAIEWAQQKAKERRIKADFRVGNVLDLCNYPDDFFDFVLDGFCFHCIIGEDRKAFLASARRVLKVGALFHLTTMCGEITSDEASQRFDLKSRCMINEEGVAVRYVGLANDILAEISEAGFLILDWKVEPRRGEDDMDDLLVDVTKT